MLKEALIILAWAQISEEDLTKEITKSMLKNEINPKFFNFRVLLPVYPPLKKYLLEDNAYENEGLKWEFNNFI